MLHGTQHILAEVHSKKPLQIYQLRENRMKSERNQTDALKVAVL